MFVLDVNFDVNKAIQQLTEALSKTVGKYGPVVWEAIIRQVYYQGVVALVWMLVFIAAAIVSYKLGMKGWRYGHALPVAKYDNDRDWVMGLSLAGMAIVLAFCTGFALWNLQNALQDFINPNWAALQLLTQMTQQ